MPSIRPQPIPAVQDAILARIAPVVESYRAPGSGFDPNGSWAHHYRLFTLCFNLFRQEGELELERRPRDDGRFTLSVRCRRSGRSGYSCWSRAELDCRPDALSTPINWRFETKLAKALDDPPYLHSGVSKRLTVREGRLLAVSDGDRPSPFASRLASSVGEAYTAKHCLFDAVQRLPGARTPEIAFAFLDEFDLPRPGHTLACRGARTLSTAGGPLALTVYQQLGPGVIPTTFWVDARGRLLFWIMGVQAMILSRVGEEEVGYETPRQG